MAVGGRLGIADQLFFEAIFPPSHSIARFTSTALIPFVMIQMFEPPVANRPVCGKKLNSGCGSRF
jgi:hypothetical protein